MFFSLFLIANACSAGQVSGAAEDETRPTSRGSQSPLSAPLARSTNPQRGFACASKHRRRFRPTRLKRYREQMPQTKTAGDIKPAPEIFWRKSMHSA
jgi:hypothetical protein